jgi:hypothetical protein
MIRSLFSDPMLCRVYLQGSCGTKQEMRSRFGECYLWLNEQMHGIFGDLERTMDVQENLSQIQVMQHQREVLTVSKLCPLIQHRADPMTQWISFLATFDLNLWVRTFSRY